MEQGGTEVEQGGTELDANSKCQLPIRIFMTFVRWNAVKHAYSGLEHVGTDLY